MRNYKYDSSNFTKLLPCNYHFNAVTTEFWLEPVFLSLLWCIFMRVQPHWSENFSSTHIKKVSNPSPHSGNTCNISRHLSSTETWGTFIYACAYLFPVIVRRCPPRTRFHSAGNQNPRLWGFPALQRCFRQLYKSWRTKRNKDWREMLRQQVEICFFFPP